MEAHFHTALLHALVCVDNRLFSAGTTGDVLGSTALHRKTVSKSRTRLEDAIEGAIAKPLLELVREVISILLCSLSQEEWSGDVSDMEQRCALISHLADQYEPVRSLLRDLSAPEILVRLLVAHPEHAGVAIEVLRALACLSGVAGVVRVLGDPELSARSVVVRAAIGALSRLPDCKCPDAQGALQWSDRLRMAQVVAAAMEAYKEDPDLQAQACSALGLLLASWAPDVNHAAASSVLPVIFHSSRTHFSNVNVQSKAAYAISNIIPGNIHAAAAVRMPEHAKMLTHVLQTHGEQPGIRRPLAHVIVSVEGLSGLVQALDYFTSDDMHNDLLWAYAHDTFGTSDDASDSIVTTGIVLRVGSLMQGRATQHSAAAALRRLMVLLFADGGNAEANLDVVEQGLGFMIESLHVKGGCSQMRAECYNGLAEIILQSEQVRAVLGVRSRLTDALTWWRTSKGLHLTEMEAVLFLCAALANKIDPILDAMHEFENWFELQQAACGALTRLGEIEPAFICSLGVRQRACHTLCDALQRHTRSHMRVAVVEVLAQALSAVCEEDGADGMVVLARGCELLIACIPYLHQRSITGTAVALKAIATLAAESCVARAVLVQGDATQTLVNVISDSAYSAGPSLLADALLTLGILGGAKPLAEAMVKFAQKYWFQVSGCMALCDLARLGQLKTLEDRQCTSSVVRQAADAFRDREHTGTLHCHAAVALTLIEVPG